MAGLFKSIADLFTWHQAELGPAGQYEDFLNKGKALAVASSNVELAQYDYETETLYIQFKGGAVYAYSSVSYVEALSFAQAGSKGGWVWDHLRIRGTKLGHRKPYGLSGFH